MNVCIEDRVCKGCGICVSTCPKKILAISARRNAKGANIVEQTNPQNCVKCKTCQDVCPIWPSGFVPDQITRSDLRSCALLIVLGGCSGL